MMTNVMTEVIKDIIVSNNKYRDPSIPPNEKIIALWEIGDILFRRGVDKPHTMGWAIQKETGGLIKRPTIFRSYKIRLIWESKELLKKDLGCIKSLSNLTEILPLIDPQQKVRKQLSNTQIQDIFSHACLNSPRDLKKYVKRIKINYAYGRLGKALDKSKYLGALDSLISDLANFTEYLRRIINSPDMQARELFRSRTSIDELNAFSNMCISLTTKQNLCLYKRLGLPCSSSKDELFRKLYGNFYSLLNKKGDYERARLRRCVSAEVLAQLSDMVSSLSSEENVKDYIFRQGLTIIIR
jgi:hypothetical protein